MDKLAIFGGKPIRDSIILYGGQSISDSDIDEVVKVLRSPLITCGPKVEEAEREFEHYLGVKHSVLVSNGTAALHCACIAAGISDGDEVITTPLTFAASANCILYCGGKPVFADINPETYNIDPNSIRACITNKTKSVIAVDYAGQAVEIDEIREICDEYGLVFIEDAAHSIGTTYNGEKVGSLADITCFSFHPVKNITSGEGGLVTTNDDSLYERIVLAHTHGIVKAPDFFVESSHDEKWYYEQLSLGYNYRMTDFQAALLLNQLRRIDQFKRRRQEIAKKYDDRLKDIPQIKLQKEIEESDSCKHLYVIRVVSSMLRCGRREFFDALWAENIRCQVHYIPVYWFPYYKKLGYEKGICPNAEEIYENIMSIPMYPKMTDGDVEDVICGINKVCNYYAV